MTLYLIHDALSDAADYLLRGSSTMSSVSWDGAGAYAFVVDHSPEGGEGDDGLLPGLCEFAEQWMVQVGAPREGERAMSHTSCPHF